MKVLLADDHDLFRDGLHQLLKQLMECHILEADSYTSVNTQCELNGDIKLLLIDLDMPGANGIDSALGLRKKLPDALIIIISGHESADVASTLLEAGFQGYIPKSSSSEIIKKAIDLVISGGVYIPSMTLSLFNNNDSREIRNNSLEDTSENLFSLTDREHEVLSLLVTGSTNKEIARSLDISVATVRTHTVSIFRTLNVNNRTQAGHIAAKLGIT